MSQLPSTPELSGEQALFAESARRFLEKACPFEERRARVARGESFDRALWARFAELGWFGVGLPEEAGGFGGGLLDAALVAEEVGRAQVLEPVVAAGILPARLLAAAGRGIEGVVAGEEVVALALGEPRTRGDLGRCETRAERVAGGWRLVGTKSLVAGAEGAGLFLVAARTADGPALFGVPADAPGVCLSPYRLVDWSGAADLALDAAVGPDALLAAGEAAAALLQRIVDEAVVLLCAEAVGAIEGAIDATAAYVKERRQFGVAIGSFQALQHRLADMAIELMQARSAVLVAIEALERGDAGASLTASGCKALVVRAGKWATAQAIQLHGGYGITEEYKVGQYFKRLHAIDALFGRAGHHLDRYAAGLAGDALRAAS